MRVKKFAGAEEWLLPRAVFLWLLSAFVLVCAASLLLNGLSVSSAALGYASSFISFASAAAAGSVLRRRPVTRPLLQSLLIGFVLVILLLTVGFLIDGEAMNPSAILSLVSFTLSGAAAGGLLFIGKSRDGRKKRRGHRFHVR